MLKGKTVLLGVTGSIAAYKIAYLASALKKLHAEVHVLMTKNATNFITPITFESLTGTKCLVDTFDRNFSFSVEHIAIAKKADPGRTCFHCKEGRRSHDRTCQCQCDRQTCTWDRR